MRVLILSVFLAYATAAPSGSIAPYIYPAVAIPAAIPTISPGDIQAAVIDAQVKYNDLARSAVDKAQEITDLSISNINEKVITDINLANERTVEALWSNEDKKWQAIDALKTAEAQIDGAAANNAAVLAKSTLAGVVPYVATSGLSAPFIAAAIPPPIPPVVYTPYAAESIATQANEIKAEEKGSMIENQETAVKNVESEKSETKVEAGDKADKSLEMSTENPANILGDALSSYNLAIARLTSISQPVINYAEIQPVNGAPNIILKSF